MEVKEALGYIEAFEVRAISNNNVIELERFINFKLASDFAKQIEETYNIPTYISPIQIVSRMPSISSYDFIVDER